MSFSCHYVLLESEVGTMFVTTEIFEETSPSDVILSFVLDGHWPVFHRLDSLGKSITDIEKARIFLVYSWWLVNRGWQRIR